MALRLEEALLVKKIDEAKEKVVRAVNYDSAEAQKAIVELVTFQADLTKLIFEKMAGIYELINNSRRPLTWSDALKQMAVHAPWALVALGAVVAIYLYVTGATVDMGGLAK